MEINNEKFVDALMTLTEQSHRNRQFLEALLELPRLSPDMRINLEQVKSTLTTYEEVVRELAEQQMQIEEGLVQLHNDFVEVREENPSSDET